MSRQEINKGQSNSTDNYQYQSTTSSNYSFINDVQVYWDSNSSNSIGEIEVKPVEYNSDISTNIPLFLEQSNSIQIPTKVEYALRRYTPKSLLRRIHPDFDVAVEFCLLFTKNLTSTYFEKLNGDEHQGWKPLKAEYLRKYYSTSSLTYKNVREALEYRLKTGAILECDQLAGKGVKSFHYRLGDAYIGKGIVRYDLKTPEAKKLLIDNNVRLFENAMQNPICTNLIRFYPKIILPTIDEIMKEAKDLVKNKHITKKGKKLVFRNKHSNSYFKNPKKLSFVEDDIALYRYLTEDRLRIPRPGGASSGGRIVDSFTLMPSWIRKLIKIDGEQFTECDYSCLHPNIACSLYGGKQEYLKHADLALATGIDDAIVKKEHLSFFNKPVRKMKPSPLFGYYQEHEPVMMKRITEEKYNSPEGHKITAHKMFAKEVEVMTDVIIRLNEEGIYVGYIYDALFCQPKQADRVKKIMDEVVLEHGVKTIAKYAA